MTQFAPLPIDAILPDLVAALRGAGRAVLQAPPGAGKTTRVPLAILDAGLVTGRILMLEPRRLAARASAERMAETLGEACGETVGYRIRGEAKTSARTRIEVVTEGILTRMIQSDPELPGIGAILFDEFHERSLNADLGLALALEGRAALREDLMLVVMSATLDAAPVAALMEGAPVLTSEGRAFPVERIWLDQPRPKAERFENGMAALIRRALAETTGGVLAFLPGEGEIRRTAAQLSDLPAGVSLHPLYGALPFAEQRAAIRPPEQGRKLVLATSIAETSLTIEGVHAVVDGGRARRARFDPGSGMSRLVTEPASRAEAEQRAGRAGRLSPGRAYRLWTKGEDGARPAHAPAEIEAADLTGLALELAQWGADDLPFLTPPPEAALAEARALLRDLGALDQAGSITAHGRVLAGLPLHPRLGHMIAIGGKTAAPLAALLADRDPLRGASADLSLRLAALRGDRQAAAQAHRPALERIRTEAKRLAAAAPRPTQGQTQVQLDPAQLLALAYPDRIGLRRPGDAPRWLLSGGKGAVIDAADPLAGQRLLVAADLDGDTREARIRLALPIAEGALREVLGDRIGWVQVAEWSRRERRVIAREQERLGAIALSDRTWKDAPPEALSRAALDGLRQLGLPWSGAARRLQARAELYRAEGGEIADLSEPALLETLETWLLPHLTHQRTAEDLRALDLLPALEMRLGWDAKARLDREVPARFTTPTGRAIPIDYSGDAPEIALKLQEMFGTTVHPTVGPKRLPLRITLLSPAGRPLQTTMDIPGFWTGAYADVRKDMRGRYPRHPWPEDPTEAAPTLRAKPRGT
ncbi:MAG: ATP-dependent helicase HrpB [Confluentimicrobium sp.]|nr:ATP-dependent helicase HrpB [Actibacterium sp.]